MPTFRDATTWFPAKWRLRDKLRNTMRENLKTRLKYHTEDLRSASD